MASDINDKLDTLLKIQELVTGLDSAKPTDIVNKKDPPKNDEIEILKIAIRELRQTFDHVSNIYDQLRVKALGILAGEVALATFMFSGSGIPVPSVTYGRIFFFTGAFFLALAFGLLLWTISPLQWKMPYDQFSSQTLRDKFKTTKSFLEYLNDDHIVAVQHCQKYVSLRAKRFNWTIYLLSAGAIILMVIKFGGTH